MILSRPDEQQLNELKKLVEENLSPEDAASCVTFEEKLSKFLENKKKPDPRYQGYHVIDGYTYIKA